MLTRCPWWAPVVVLAATSVVAAVVAPISSAAEPRADNEPGAAAPSITLVLDSIPDAAQDFGFTTCAGVACTTFDLDDDSDPTRGSSVTGSGLAPGTYTLSQAPAPSGWTLVDIQCDTGEVVDLGTRTATVTLTAGEEVTCTFLNRAPAIRIVADEATGGGHDFSYTGCQGAGCSTFSLDDDNDAALPGSVTGAPLAPGTYTITQAPDASWPLSALTCSTGEVVNLAARAVTITLEATEFAVCTFTNVTQTLTIVQDTEPDSGTDFGYTGCQGAGCAPFSLDDDADPTLPASVTATELPPGTYTITQAATAGYDLTALDCSPAELTNIGTRVATIGLTAGEHVTCTFTDRPSPPVVPVTQITAGFSQGCAVVAGGQARCWGENASGVLGDGTTTDRVLPVTVSDPGGTGPLTDVSMLDTAGFQTTPSVVTSRTCARLTTGQARCWGGTSPSGFTRPGVIMNSNGSAPLLGVSEVGTGPDFSCARLSGQVRCWGNNASGRLGDGTTTSRALPVSVLSVDGAGPLVEVAQLTVGQSHACALLATSEVRCWGANSRGQLGDGTFTPRSQATVVSNEAGTGPLTGVTEVSAGNGLTCARLTSGEARCWGAQTGDGTGPNDNRTRPVSVLDGAGGLPLTGVTHVTAGGSVGSLPGAGFANFRFGCVSLTSGQMRCWGTNQFGQLGDGTTSTRLFPVVVSNSGGTGPLTDVAQVTAGGFSTCGVLVDGGARCWGLFPGDGNASSVRPAPVYVT